MGLLRLILALSVVAVHTGGIWGSKLVGAQVAVQSFYIISGFYMSLILNEKYIGVNGSYKLFITNRFIRLYPIFWAILAVTILACLLQVLFTNGQSLALFQSYFTVKSNLFTFSFLIFSNAFIFGQDLVMFLGINPDTGRLFFTNEFWTSKPPLYTFLFIQQAWTLGLELTFYLIAPFILRKRFRVVIILITLSLMLRFFMYDYLDLKNDPWSYRFFPTELMFFLLGNVSYQIHLKIKNIKIPMRVSLGALFFILFFTLIYPYLPSFKVSYFPFQFKACAYFFMIIISVPLLFNFLKRNSLDTKIGDLSYPVYTSHLLVILVCSWIQFEVGWFVATITIIFSFYLNKFIASPIEKYRQSRIKTNS